MSFIEIIKEDILAKQEETTKDPKLILSFILILLQHMRLVCLGMRASVFCSEPTAFSTSSEHAGFMVSNEIM